MNDYKKDPLYVTGVHSILGAFGGMVCGAVFLYLIMAVSSYLPVWPGQESNVGGPPVQVAMIAGSIVGAILGGVVGLRKSK